MTRRSGFAIAMIYLVTLPNVARAQVSDVTFTVPLNLTQLSPEIGMVMVRCQIQSAAIVGTGQSLAITRHPPSNGRVVGTANVRVPIAKLDSSAGTTATYTCALQALKGTSGQSLGFSANATDPALRLSPTPTPITGSFNWLDVAPGVDVAPSNATTTSPGGNP